jgi:hypothetical protein
MPLVKYFTDAKIADWDSLVLTTNLGGKTSGRVEEGPRKVILVYASEMPYRLGSNIETPSFLYGLVPDLELDMCYIRRQPVMFGRSRINGVHESKAIGFCDVVLDTPDNPNDYFILMNEHGKKQLIKNNSEFVRAYELFPRPSTRESRYVHKNTVILSEYNRY